MKYCFKAVLPLLLLFAFQNAFAQGTETYNGHSVKAHQVLFRLNSSSSAVVQRLMQMADADDFRALNRNLNIHVLRSRSANVAALLSILKLDPAVVYVEPDYIVKPVATTPNECDVAEP